MALHNVLFLLSIVNIYTHSACALVFPPSRAGFDWRAAVPAKSDWENCTVTWIQIKMIIIMAGTRKMVSRLITNASVNPDGLLQSDVQWVQTDELLFFGRLDYKQTVLEQCHNWPNYCNQSLLHVGVLKAK